MKVVHIDEAHNFHVDWYFKFGVEKLGKAVARQDSLFKKAG
jgi:hypothetical protein